MTNVLLSFYHLHTQNKIISKKTNKIKGYILIIPSVKSYKYDPQYQTEGENEKKKNTRIHDGRRDVASYFDEEKLLNPQHHLILIYNSTFHDMNTRQITLILLNNSRLFL